MNPSTRSPQFTTRRQPLIERLEARQLLSASTLALHHGYISATVGSPSQGAVAIVVGKNVPTSAADYQATIDWGDSSAPDPNITVSTTHGGKAVTLTASHVYAQPGKFVVKVDVLVNGQQPETVQDRLHVRPFPARLALIRAQEGAPFSGTVGTGLAPLPAGDALTIEWGDGTLTSATATVSGTHTIITGTHTYVQPGKYFVSITRSMVDNTNGTQIDALILRGRAIVRPDTVAPILARVVEINPVTGIATDTAPAKLVNVPLTINIAKVQIDWGDGSPIDTSNVANSQGTIIPAAGHIYQHTGIFKVVVTFNVGDRVLTARQTVTVTDVSTGGLHLATVTGSRFVSVVGTISHLFPQLAASTGPLLPPDAVGVEWGDGTRSPGTFVSLGNDQYQVTGGHLYTKPGTYVVIVVGGIAGTAPWPIPGTPQSDVLPVAWEFTTAQSLMTVTGGDVVLPPPSVQASGLPLPDMHTGTLNTSPIAQLTGLIPDGYRADIYVVVDWGDATPSDPIGPITDYENGAFIARGGHQYSAGGTYTISVTFLLNDHIDTTQNTVLASTTTSLKVLT